MKNEGLQKIAKKWKSSYVSSFTNSAQFSKLWQISLVNWSNTELVSTWHLRLHFVFKFRGMLFSLNYKNQPIFCLMKGLKANLKVIPFQGNLRNGPNPCHRNFSFFILKPASKIYDQMQKHAYLIENMQAISLHGRY